MYIISMFIVVLGSYALGWVLAQFFFGFVFDLIAERNVRLAILYLVVLLILLIAALVYVVMLL